MPSTRPEYKQPRGRRDKFAVGNHSYWVKVGARSFFIDMVDEPDPENKDVPRVCIVVTPPMKNADLTRFTTAEVEAMKEFYNLAFDRALEVTRKLDQRALEALEQGDTTYRRLWRPDPVVRVFNDKYLPTRTEETCSSPQPEPTSTSTDSPSTDAATTPSAPTDPTSMLPSASAVDSTPPEASGSSQDG